MIAARRVQMFDNTGSRDHCPPRYDARTVECPIVAFVGGRDTLTDIDLLESALPINATVLVEPLYEHLDYLWGRDLASRVYPVVVKKLREHSGVLSNEAVTPAGISAETGDASSFVS